MKRMLSVLLSGMMLFWACMPIHALSEPANTGAVEFAQLNDPELLAYVEDTLYAELVSQLKDGNYFVENVDAIYISQEYLEELAYNSQVNVFFGYTLAELEEQFQNERYIFTLDDNGQTTVKSFEGVDHSYASVLRNVAVGTGVILICVTVSAVSAGIGAPAISMIFAASAKTGTMMALSGGALGSVSAGIVAGIETKDVDAALKAAVLGGSEGFKWGALSGTIVGGAEKAVALKGATLHGLTMNEAALIQRESGYPLDVIKEFASMEQYEICKGAGLQTAMVNNHMALIRPIDLNYVDDSGRSNLERMRQGVAALDPMTGESYQLHHIGQRMDSTLAVLTRYEHMQGGNNTIWHVFGEETQIQSEVFAVQRQKFWRETAEILLMGEN